MWETTWKAKGSPMRRRAWNKDAGKHTLWGNAIYYYDISPRGFFYEEKRFLFPFPFNVPFHIHFAHRVRIESRIEHYRRCRHRSRREILNLIRMYPLQDRIFRKTPHVFHSASWMCRYEIRDKQTMLSGTLHYPVEFRSQPAEQSEGRLGHEFQHTVFSVLRSDLQYSGRMFKDEFFQVRTGLTR